MNSRNYDELKKVLEQLCEERKILLDKIDDNSASIQEIDRHTEDIAGKDDDEFQVFSPRSARGLYKEELEELEKKKFEVQQQNNQLFHNRNKLNSIINVLEKIIDEEGITNKKFAILNIQEDDRHRIARDLHDSSLQNLTHMIHKIELCTLFIDQDPVRAKLELAVMSKSIKEIINEIRNTIYDLRPMSFDDLSLKDSLERLLSQINSERQFEIDADIDDVSCENKLILVSIYRVIQESFVNIQKHAEADKIIFHCKQKDNLCVIDIEDNGKGFLWEEVQQKEGKHFGLSMMKERVLLMGGKYEIVSEVNAGTKINITVPLS